jgi:hypothetical protein
MRPSTSDSTRERPYRTCEVDPFVSVAGLTEVIST